ANDKMEFIWDTVVETINEENGKTGSVTMKNVKTGEKSEFKTDGVFIYIGMVPLSEPFKELGIVDEEGYVPYNEDMETRVLGILAVDDIKGKRASQIRTVRGED